MENNYDIITRINKAYSGMSKRHKQIASYILEHYDQAAFMTAAKMGEALSISESTAVRFAAASAMKATRKCRLRWLPG